MAFNTLNHLHGLTDHNYLSNQVEDMLSNSKDRLVKTTEPILYYRTYLLIRLSVYNSQLIEKMKARPIVHTIEEAHTDNGHISQLR